MPDVRKSYDMEQKDFSLLYFFGGWAGGGGGGGKFPVRIYTPVGLEKIFWMENLRQNIRDKVREGSKSALLQTIMKFGYFVCVCLW